MAAKYNLARDANGGTELNVRFIPTNITQARAFAQARADLDQRTVILEYFDPNNGTGVVKETFTPGAAVVAGISGVSP